MNIQRLKLVTSKLWDLKHFYQDILGFEVLNTREKSLVLKIGKSTLEFEEDLTFYKNPINYHFAFNISANQLENAIIWLKEKNIDLLLFQNKVIIDFPNWNAQATYFLDPAQNIVEFIARRDLNNTSQASFSVENITEISEIGFPVPEIAPFYKKIEKELKIPMYSHISNLERFCAAGNPEGLFIIVPLERAWFPTEIINDIFPTEVYLKANQKKEVNFENLPYKIIAS